MVPSIAWNSGVKTAYTTNDVIIRPATIDDTPVLGRLGALLVKTHHDFDPRRFLSETGRTEAAYGAFLGSQLQEPNVALLVAEKNRKVLGYAYAAAEGVDYMALRGPAGVLYDIIVDPAHRGHGVGRMLLQAALASLKELGAPRVVLSTAERNEPAQKLFASAGFRRTMIEMTRELDS